MAKVLTDQSGENNPRAKLRDIDIRLIQTDLLAVPNTTIAKHYGVSHQRIAQIKNGIGKWERRIKEDDKENTY